MEEAADIQCIPMESIGFILKRDKEHIVIAQTVGMNNQTSAIIAIPAGCVTKVRTIKRREKKGR